MCLTHDSGASIQRIYMCEDYGVITWYVSCWIASTVLIFPTSVKVSHPVAGLLQRNDEGVSYTYKVCCC